MPAIHIRLGRRILLQQSGKAVEFGFRMQQSGLGGQQLRLGFLEFGLVGILLDDKQNLSFLDNIALPEQHLLEKALDSRSQLHGIERLGVPGKLKMTCHHALPGMAHRHLGRGWRLIGVGGITAGKAKGSAYGNPPENRRIAVPACPCRGV